MTLKKPLLALKLKNKASSQVERFYREVWKTANKNYFGKQINWSEKVKVIEAYDGKQLVGVAELRIHVGVMYVFELAVAYSHQRKGIGRMLMEKAEEIAKQEKLHKIHFDTGKTWGTSAFYEKLGYKKTGEFPKHFGGHDYIQFSKFL